ncbi:DUF1549 and DUF1553 domain-containing protein [Roseibacillus ishigakijimensis]|uniref:DUF1549 domain-containing protein n=1 Tax=Roseibacillus ishigakijimensis TaxID=454146 RepID=A0A934RQ51_9BACT|nr:DUF1549 and DUF1553 domain-containing protein [Roseibacillus ishigakijimensis]MBK1833049.1 DUF1549 domain-containing protein [Roseibacillus ishigakijimensis]
MIVLVLLLFCLPLWGQGHWAYEPPQAPVLQGEGHPIDELLAIARKEEGLAVNELATPREWLERAAYTLTGLPPSAAQLRKLAAEPSEEGYLQLVEELLDSPAYGERWARNWMDVARYADTQGYNFDRDNRYPFAYTYRDWLVQAFNEDLPFDEFVHWQIAGDHLTEKEEDPNLAALGFLTVGQRAGRVETIDDRVDVVTRGFLGTTVSCARCHEHKFDPITTEDYYSLFSIFENLREPEEKPVIGQPDDQAAFEDFQQQMAAIDENDLNYRREFVAQLREPESLAVYLELAWQAGQEDWDEGKATGEAFKRGRYRPKAVIRWRDFLRDQGAGVARLQAWQEAMAKPAERAEAALALAREWAEAEEGDLARLRGESSCPLSYDEQKVRQFYDTKDNQENARFRSERAALQMEHAGSPPRAMVVRDRKDWLPAQVYLRGDPNNRSEAFERHWLSFLGGEKFGEGKSPRLSLAEKITEVGNPLTARVYVNRVWNWHFGQALTEPSDYGYEVPEPPLLPLLDYLALYFQEQGYSSKALHRHLLSSRAFRLSAMSSARNRERDEGNRFYWRWQPQRLDFEVMRDRMLVTAGRLNLAQRGGPAARLGEEGMATRRTLYAFVDRYQLDSDFVAFDLPHPDLHAARRVETIVPQQSLYLLNGEGVMAAARHLAAAPELAALAEAGAQVDWIYERIFQRSPSAGERRRAVEWLQSAEEEHYLPPLSGYWEVRYAPMKEGELGEEKSFPLFADGVWKTGPGLSKAPLRWLHAGAQSGHPLRDYALILRFRATAAGEIRLRGNLRRSSATGDTLAWEIRGNDGRHLAGGDLPPGAKRSFQHEAVPVKSGEAISFLLLAPEGQNSGHTSWDFAVEGRQREGEEWASFATLGGSFPQSEEVPPLEEVGSPLADLIQMLWASNEFHYIY